MLSNREIATIPQELANDPPRNIRKKLRKKLKEHKYASLYPPFTPLSYYKQFINRKTDEETLVELIHIASDSDIFLLDTESIMVHHQPNRPGLIQLQIIQRNTSSIVLIIEINHLPLTYSMAFQLIKEFFRIVLDSTKVIYTWGSITELNDFVQFNLFDAEQIKSSDNRDLQDIFKQFWQQCHEHKTTNDCRCEQCIKKNPDGKWSLQDAVAYQLGEWLDKRQTCSPFNIGLDPKLNRSQDGLEFRETLIQYAVNDCLSMEKLMISIQEHPPNEVDQIVGENGDAEINQNRETFIDQGSQHKQHQSTELLENDEQHQSTKFLQNDKQDQSDHTDRKRHRSNNSSESEAEFEGRSKRIRWDHHLEEEQTLNQWPSSGNRTEQHDRSSIPNKTKEERKYRNRIATLKQRKRHYKHEIIQRGIDSRFSITMVKEILRRYDISYTAVNILKSLVTGRTSLYIGIKNERELREHAIRIKNLFTTDFYNEFRARHHLRR